MRSPPSTDSNKKEAPSPRNLRYKLTGVSRSADTSRMMVWTVVASSNIIAPFN